MPLESLDQVSSGDWLICVQGPMTIPKSSSWYPVPESKPERDRILEGVLVQVLAITPPMMLVEWHILHGKDRNYSSPIHWDYVSWSKASPEYVKEYLKKSKERLSENELKTRPVNVTSIFRKDTGTP